MEFLSFRHADQHFALPIDSVRFITADNSLKITQVATGDGQLREVVDYDGQACVLLSLASILGQHSAVNQANELIELLSAREQDHVDWLDALEQSLTQGSEFSKARDPHQCAFGRWYQDFTTDNTMLAQLLEKFDAPHKRIHALADELLNQASGGHNDSDKKERKDAALAILNEHKRTTLIRLQSLFADARQLLATSIRPTVIMIQAGEQVIGLRVDDIGEVFSCQQDQFCQHAQDYLPGFGRSWIKDAELSDGRVTVLLLEPEKLLNAQPQIQQKAQQKTQTPETQSQSTELQASTE